KKNKTQTQKMRATLTILLLVITVAAIGFATMEEYNFPTGEMLRRCATHEECGIEGWCENVNGDDGGIDGRRGHQCRARFHAGVSCLENVHCKSGYCEQTTKKCGQKNYD
ncbi:hypothetical protein HY484_02400, partial [Candidatus Woesearchaeota archaeon]|nr:hypothetical protein [Candidatus Woesearchaeota archaeon]